MNPKFQQMQEYAEALKAEVDQNTLKQYVEKILPDTPAEGLMTQLISHGQKAKESAYQDADETLQELAIRQELKSRMQ